MIETDKVLALTELLFRFTNENRRNNCGIFSMRNLFFKVDQKSRKPLCSMEKHMEVSLLSTCT